MLRQLSSCRGRPRHLILVRELSRLRLSDDLTAHVVRLPRACPVPDGAAWETLTDTLKDGGNVFGSRLEVYLPVPSKVNVYRDERLIGTGFYPAGKQELDTSSFPDGAYTVQLEIIGQNGSRSE